MIRSNNVRIIERKSFREKKRRVPKIELFLLKLNVLCTE